MRLFKRLFPKDNFRETANEVIEQAYQNGVIKLQRAVWQHCDAHGIVLDWRDIERRLLEIERISPKPKLK